MGLSYSYIPKSELESLTMRRDYLRSKLDEVYLGCYSSSEIPVREFKAKYLKEELEKVNQELKNCTTVGTSAV